MRLQPEKNGTYPTLKIPFGLVRAPTLLQDTADTGYP